MKHLLSSSVFGLVLLLTISSCKKVEGPGGTSAIRGNVTGTKSDTVNLGEYEVIHVTAKKGTDIEHGDYWLLNGSSNGQLYYIWYNNPTWISNGDPQLQGRTGIQVNFNYSDNNTTVAMNTADALIAVVLNDFTVELNQDILTLTSTSRGDLPDADNGNTSFNVDVANQGQADVFDPSTTISMADERVYLIYGDGENFNESMKTGAGGEFTFDGLNPGTYKVYALSFDPITGEKMPVYKTVEITDKGAITEAGTIEVMY